MKRKAKKWECSPPEYHGERGKLTIDGNHYMVPEEWMAVTHAILLVADALEFRNSLEECK